MPPQDDAGVITTVLFFPKGRALAILIIAILGLVPQAPAGPATALKNVHDAFHGALRDADPGPLDQLLSEQFLWTDGEGHVWNKSLLQKRREDLYFNTSLDVDGE